mgnify:FL=1
MKKHLNRDGVMGYPDAMKEQPFCCWRWEKQKGRETKVPYDPKTGAKARTDTPETFGTMAEAMEALYKNRYSGIGFNITEGGSERARVGCIDHDHCVEDGVVKESVLAALDMLPDAVVEYSPSGTGLHQFFLVPDGFVFDKDVYYVNNRKGGKEIYLPGVTNHFMTITGDIYRTGGMEVTAEQLQAFLDAYMKRKTLMKVAVSVPEGGSVLSDDDVLYKLSHELDKKFIDMYEGNWEQYGADENWSQSDADMTVLMKLAFYCRGDMGQMDRLFRASGLMRDKWDRGLAGSTYGVVSMTNAVNRCSAFYEPDHNCIPASEDFEEVYEDGSGDSSDHASFCVDDFFIAEVVQDGSGDHTGLKSEEDGVGSTGEDLCISEDDDINTVKDKGDEDHSDDPEATPDLDERLERLLSSAPSTDDLYSPDNLLLAAYARLTRQADYEKLRSFAQRNKMSMKLYEQSVKEKEAKVREKQQERLERQRIKAAEYHSGKEMPDFIYYNRRLDCLMVDPSLLAIHVKDNLHYILVQDSLRDTRTKYVYEDGVYTVCSDERFRGYIKRFIEDFDPALVRMKDVDEAFRNISAGLAAIPFERLNDNEDIINFRNGLLRLSTMELLPHSPEILSTIQLSCDWTGTDEPTPSFDSYLATLTDFDWDTQKLLLQFIGAALSNVAGYRYKKALFLCGEGDTGKSQLKVLTEKLLGPNNHAAVDLPDLESQFGASMIYGKRLVGTADMTFVTVRELKMFKTVTGGDYIKVEFKGKTGFSYRYSGLLWFCSNKPPKFGGDNGSWVYNRIILINCNNVIAEADQDHDLVEKLYAERGGIVYKAIMALKETIDNGYRFSESEGIQNAREEYRYENSSVYQFIKDCMIDREKPGSVPKGDNATISMVYRVYMKYCKFSNNGYAVPIGEFKQGYADYLGLPLEKAVVRRGKGMYLAYHEPTEEAYANLLPSDAEVHRDLIFGRSVS